MEYKEGDSVRALRQLMDEGELVAEVGDEGTVVYVDEDMGNLPTCYWPKTDRYYGTHRIEKK